MRLLLAGVVAGLLAPFAPADDPKPKKPEPKLRAGDKAPVLKADKWVNGAEVKQFEAGKVYVVEFWATWCGPCITMMPHLADLADEYKGKGVTVVGFNSTAKDKKELNDKFVEKRGPKLGYTFAWEEGSETDTNWMQAAGRGGIPCSFVVGKDGALAYIGHPMFLDVVLPKVLAGATAEEIAAAETAAKEEYSKARVAMTAADPADGLKVYAGLRPEVANIPYLTGQKLGLLLKAKKYDEAKAMAAGVIAKAAKRDDTSGLSTVTAALTEVKGQPELIKLAVQAAEANVAIAGEDNLAAVMGAAEAHHAAGDPADVKRYAGRALTLAEQAVEKNKSAAYYFHTQVAAAKYLLGDTAGAKAAAERAVATADELVADKKMAPVTRDRIVTEAKKYGYEPKKSDDK